MGKILFDSIAEDNDALIVSVISVESQFVRAKILHVYTSRFSLPTMPYFSGSIEFVGETGAWGNEILKPQETAIVFVNGFPDKYKKYMQAHFRGHYSIEKINGEFCAIANWSLFEEPNWVSDELLKAAFKVESSPRHRVAMPFMDFEKFMSQRFELIGQKIIPSTLFARAEDPSEGGLNDC